MLIDTTKVDKKFTKPEGSFVLGSPINGTRDYAINKQRYYVTQGFGKNNVPFYKDMGMLGHNGIDYSIMAYKDGHAPIYAMHSGYVISDKSVQSYTKGIFVEIMSDVVFIAGKPCKVRTVYFHLSEAIVSVNLKGAKTWYGGWFAKNKNYINAGQIIGTGGNSGEYTTGPHLHVGMYIHWKQPNGSFQMDSINGYHGAVNFMPFMYDFNVYEEDPDYHFNGVKLTNFEQADKMLKKYNH